MGIGGYFIRAADPVRLGAWYRDCLGLDLDEHGVWHPDAGPTVLRRRTHTDYFGSRAQQTMLNFRVRDLDDVGSCGPMALMCGRDGTCKASAASVGSPTPRAIESSCGNPPDLVTNVADEGADRSPVTRQG